MGLFDHGSIVPGTHDILMPVVWSSFLNSTEGVAGSTVLALSVSVEHINGTETVAASKHRSNIAGISLFRTEEDRDANELVRRSLVAYLLKELNAPDYVVSCIEQFKRSLFGNAPSQEELIAFNRAFKPEDFNSEARGKPLTVRRVRSILQFVKEAMNKKAPDNIEMDELEDSGRRARPQLKIDISKFEIEKYKYINDLDLLRRMYNTNDSYNSDEHYENMNLKTRFKTISEEFDTGLDDFCKWLSEFASVTNSVQRTTMIKSKAQYYAKMLAGKIFSMRRDNVGKFVDECYAYFAPFVAFVRNKHGEKFLQEVLSECGK